MGISYQLYLIPVIFKSLKEKYALEDIDSLIGTSYNAAALSLACQKSFAEFDALAGNKI